MNDESMKYMRGTFQSMFVRAIDACENECKELVELYEAKDKITHEEAEQLYLYLKHISASAVVGL